MATATAKATATAREVGTMGVSARGGFFVSFVFFMGFFLPAS